MTDTTSSPGPAGRHPDRVQRLLVAVMVVAALAHLVIQILPLVTKQEMDFIVIPLLGATFSLASACYVLGWRSAATFLVLALGLSWLSEEIGVRTGAIFGAYVYGEQLGPKLGSVPYVIPVFWFMILYVAYAITNLIAEGTLDFAGRLGQTLWLSLLAAFVATAYDLGLDPYMSSPAIGAWTWLDGGPYFGVPLRNFIGWIGTGFVILFLFHLTHRTVRQIAVVGRLSHLVAALPILVYASFWLSLLGESHPGPTRVICLISLGIPSLAAASVWRRWRVESQAPAGAATG